MGIFGKKAAPANAQSAVSGGRVTYTRLDGTTVQLTQAEFVADEAMMRESYTARMLEFVDEGLPLVGGGPELRAALLTAIWNLTWEAQRTDDLALMSLIAQVSAAYTPLSDMPMDEIGDTLLDTAEDVRATLRRLHEDGRDSFAQDLSLLAATQLNVQEARPNHELVMAAIMSAAKRRGQPPQ